MTAASYSASHQPAGTLVYVLVKWIRHCGESSEGEEEEAMVKEEPVSREMKKKE